jgi:hypothetical protein
MLKTEYIYFCAGNPVNSTVYGECQVHDRLFLDIVFDCLSLGIIGQLVALPIKLDTQGEGGRPSVKHFEIYFKWF